MKKVLVTGVSGFIGAAVAAALLDRGYEVTGLDNLNDYYDVDLKCSRLELLGIDRKRIEWNESVVSQNGKPFSFIRMSLDDQNAMQRLFVSRHFDMVASFGGQAGVRYSLENPGAFVESNIGGFVNVLEGCRRKNVGHLVYASSSSVYGLNGKTPFSEHDAVSHPVSLYAATKRSNELMAHAYSELFGLPTTGLRFFTVYGPWGRPDMSPFLFIDAILHDRPIQVFNEGDMWRDFTYIDDIVESVVRILEVVPQEDSEWDSMNPDPASSKAPYRLYNIGNQCPVRLMDYIECIERITGKKALKEYLPMQQGDIYKTFSDTSALESAIGYRPDTPLEEGLRKTVDWYMSYYGKRDD